MLPKRIMWVKSFGIIWVVVLQALLLTTSCQQIKKVLALDDETRVIFRENVPLGMTYVPAGTLRIGENSRENSQENNYLKTVSVNAFWMDETEITNNEYRQFVVWVKDSIVRQILSEQFPEFTITTDEVGNPLPKPRINYATPIDATNQDYVAALQVLAYSKQDALLQDNGFEFDVRKIKYLYEWIDFDKATQYAPFYNPESGLYDANDSTVTRRSFIKRANIAVYPDTLVWVRDFTYAFNEPLTENYFKSAAFDNYPVVGVNWHQAKAFCNWRTRLQEQDKAKFKEFSPYGYRLPTEAEWEMAALGTKQSLYPWGSYYTRNQGGCFVANFKPMRGNYVADNNIGTTTTQVALYDANDFGLFDMAGNVAEWTNDVYTPEAHNLMSDFNPSIHTATTDTNNKWAQYKVVKGGSWKDVAYFLRSGTRSAEDENQAKSYIGFRCVRSSFRQLTSQSEL